MAKFGLLHEDEQRCDYMFECPGCGNAHYVRVRGDRAWQWDGNVDRPTVSPSLLVRPGTESQCHSFITDGKIQFLGDCWHELKGQTVEIPDWE